MSAITNMTELMEEVLRLRQQLAETHAHLDTQRQATYWTVEREHAAKKQLTTLHAHVQEQQVEYAKNAGTIQHLKQQLAEVTQERDFYKKASRTAGYDALLSCGHTYEENVANVFGQWKQAIDDALNAERQLAEVTQERDAMSELLTRGQLMDLVRYLDNTAEYLAGSDGVAAADILKHDAALRQQLAEVTQERDMLVKGVAPRRSPGPAGVSVQKGDV